jgi:tetratricopeptide (TPR) repeat protein
LDYVILDVDITWEELEEIIADANKIISDHNESKENLAVAYLKKAQCLRKLGEGHTVGFICYEETGFFFGNEMGISIEAKDLKELLTTALRLSPDMPEAFMQLGLLNSTDLFGSYQDQAIYLFTKAIELKPDYAAAFNNRAMVDARIPWHSSYHSPFYDRENYYDSEKNGKRNQCAVADLTEANRIRPFDALYHLNRATFYSRLDEHNKAVEDFNKVIDYDQGKLKEKLMIEVLIYKLPGKEYLELKEYGKAIDDFSESLRLKPDDEGLPEFYYRFNPSNSVLLLRAKAYYMAGEKDKSKKVFEEYLNKIHNDADTVVRKNIYELTALGLETFDKGGH